MFHRLQSPTSTEPPRPVARRSPGYIGVRAENCRRRDEHLPPSHRLSNPPELPRPTLVPIQGSAGLREP